MTDLDRLDALAEKATKPPWEAPRLRWRIKAGENFVFESSPDDARTEADATFIAALVNAYPALSRELREARAQIHGLCAMRDSLVTRHKEYIDNRDRVEKDQRIIDNTEAVKMLRENSSLRAEVERLKLAKDDSATLATLDEKDRRIYYQNIVYHVCNALDRLHARKPGTGIVCGTKDEPSTRVQQEIDAVVTALEWLNEVDDMVGR